MLIVSATPCDATIVRVGGDGDNFYMTWAADNSMLIALCDGSGLPGATSRELFNSRLFRTHDSPDAGLLSFSAVDGYPRKILNLIESRPEAPFYGFATIAIGDTIYQWLSTLASSAQAERGMPAADVFVGAKLIYSPDNGATWCNQDGTSPVRWESASERSLDTMYFWNEPQSSFALPAVLQMGRAYGTNSDGFVYLYAPNGVVEGTMNELVMLRVPTDRVRDRGECEYFAGYDERGQAKWSRQIEERTPTLRFPEGWVTSLAHPYSWQPSVIYNEPMNIYMLASWGMPATPEGWWFTGPSYLGIWVSSTPWGPWRQVHEDSCWTPGGDRAARCYQPQLSPKWISEDGRSVWLVWTDFQPAAPDEDFFDVLRAIREAPISHEEMVDRLAETRPYYSMNIQRVDLTVDA